MFPDLSDKIIQPKSIDAQHVLEIEFSDQLKSDLHTVLEEEENKYVRLCDKTVIVQTDKNYVFFSNHWFYLAVLCKKYAEALKTYGDFFDKKIRGDWEKLRIFISQDYESPVLKELIPESVDRDRMIKYIEGGSKFRPGKSLINGDSVRSTKDIFGSCVLKKIEVPDASSAYLGNLIYYLSKRPKLFDAVEEEVQKQLGGTTCATKLPSVAKDCAKVIVDYIYKIDGFKRMSERFENNAKHIKINTSNTDGLLPEGNFLRYMFACPSSDMYNFEGSGKPRVFEDEYIINIDGHYFNCRLTTEWIGAEVKEDMQGNNYLHALIVMVNKYYSDLLEIREESEGYYLSFGIKDFKLNSLPEIFCTDISRRYITSLLAKPFVILTGNSGTGKTRIATQFAEYLEITDKEGEKNWLIVPVGADWTDNSKVLGFYNPFADNGAGSYEKTEILKLLEKSNANPDIPYFIILDEMNLSHVERYFSDFLSHMEIPDDPFEIDGYDKKEKLVYPKNLFVVGTVNIDETTYMFSPKVLDRANVVEFKPKRDDVLALFDSNEYSGRVNPANNGMAEAFLRLAKEIRNGKCNIASEDSERQNMADVKSIFTSVYEVLEKRGFEFAYRTVREIRQYISAAYELSDKEQGIDLYHVVDEQLLQKVLPKIHGNRKEIGELLDELEKICIQDGISLKLSERKIKQMKGKLANVQYASFI